MEQYNEQQKAEEKYPGIAIDKADDEKVSEQAIDERTCTLGYNPRNDE